MEKIRDYSILSTLGEGGMGTVYLARDEMLDRKVALKVLNPMLTMDAQFVQRFRQEAKVQSTMTHPGIVGLYTFFNEGGTYCMVMEYAEGETLKSLIERSGRLPEARALEMLRQMLEAVGYAHGKGIIHRDIKPSNVMIGQADLVKIMDFGIAKILGDRGMTKTGAKLGTLYYMSPEQVRAAKDIDHRTDIYSLGVTFYEMLTGQLPFDADTDSDFEIMQQIVEREVGDPRRTIPAISERASKTLMKSVHKDPKDRISSCAEWIAALVEHGARRPSPLPRSQTKEANASSHRQKSRNPFAGCTAIRPQLSEGLIAPGETLYWEGKPRLPLGLILVNLLFIGGVIAGIAMQSDRHSREVGTALILVSAIVLFFSMLVSLIKLADFSSIRYAVTDQRIVCKDGPAVKSLELSAVVDYLTRGSTSYFAIRSEKQTVEMKSLRNGPELLGLLQNLKQK